MTGQKPPVQVKRRTVEQSKRQEGLACKAAKVGKSTQWHDSPENIQSLNLAFGFVCITKGLIKMAEVWTRPARFSKPGRSLWRALVAGFEDLNMNGDLSSLRLEYK